MVHKRPPAILLIYYFLILSIFFFLILKEMEIYFVGKKMMRGLEHKNFFVPPIPYWWHTLASPLPGKAHAVGCQIWFVFKTVSRGKHPVKLSRQYFSLSKLDRKTVSRALVNLEKAGLITTERGKGKAPVITINTDEQKVTELRQQWIDRKHRGK